MRGHLEQRTKGSWTIWIELPRDPATGKRRQQTVTVRATKKDAERRLAELQHQVNTGGFVQPTKLTVGEFLKRWLRDFAAVNVRPGTLDGYRERAKHLIAGLGNIPLSELRPEHLQGYFALKHSSLSPGTLIKHHNLVHKVLSDGMRLGLIGRNVADAIDPPRPSRKEMRALTPIKCIFYWTPVAILSGIR